MNSFSKWLRQLGRPAVFAHRGASRAAPENSLAALRLASELGADGVEFDVQRCGSGELVVFHDHTLARCTGALGSVNETPLTALKQMTLDPVARARGLPLTGEEIPTLDEWLSAAPRGLFLNLEVKCEVLAEAEAAAPCLQALTSAGLSERSVVSSFHPAALRRAATTGSGIPLGTLVEDSAQWRVLMAAGLIAGGRAVHPPSSLVTPARVKWWHRLGCPVAVWTVDEAREAERCLDAGADVLISNRPELIRPIAERYSRR
jgi:glycerophosphoryl diester phosphodiesterase